MHPFLFKYI